MAVSINGGFLVGNKSPVPDLLGLPKEFGYLTTFFNLLKPGPSSLKQTALF